MPQIEHRRVSRLKPESMVLLPYRRNVASQLGEDGILERIFEIIGTTNKWCVEFGAADGKFYANTWNLIHNAGWSGVLLEPKADRFRTMQENYKDLSASVHLLNAAVGLEPGSTLDELLESTKLPRSFDLLSIDIDGNDWHIWNSLTRYQPQVVIIEFNPSIENDIYFVQDYGATVSHGSSLLALIELGRSKGYELVGCTDWNAFFVRRDLFPKFGITDNSIDALYEAHNVIKIFQGYDGTMFAVGNLALYWLQIPLTQADFQVIPDGVKQRFGS